MAEPYARYANGRILWRGTSPTFTYMTPEDARALLRAFAAEDSDRGLSGWLYICDGFVRDLSSAIAEQDAETMETGSYMK
jgi:hypothetical protein